jgi:acetolactate synthase-1/2/3 large subunit
MPADVADALRRIGVLRTSGPHAPDPVRQRRANWSTLSKWRSLDGAFASNSTPRGPVYLRLPREVLCEQCPSDGLESPPRRYRGCREAPERGEEPADHRATWAGSAEGLETLSHLAEEWGIAICLGDPAAAPTDDPMAVGGDPAEWLAKADLVLVIDIF